MKIAEIVKKYHLLIALCFILTGVVLVNGIEQKTTEKVPAQAQESTCNTDGDDRINLSCTFNRTTGSYPREIYTVTKDYDIYCRAHHSGPVSVHDAANFQVITDGGHPPIFAKNWVKAENSLNYGPEVDVEITYGCGDNFPVYTETIECPRVGIDPNINKRPGEGNGEVVNTQTKACRQSEYDDHECGLIFADGVKDHTKFSDTARERVIFSAPTIGTRPMRFGMGSGGSNSLVVRPLMPPFIRVQDSSGLDVQNKISGAIEKFSDKEETLVVTHSLASIAGYNVKNNKSPSQNVDYLLYDPPYNSLKGAMWGILEDPVLGGTQAYIVGSLLELADIITFDGTSYFLRSVDTLATPAYALVELANDGIRWISDIVGLDVEDKGNVLPDQPISFGFDTLKNHPFIINAKNSDISSDSSVINWTNGMDPEYQDLSREQLRALHSKFEYDPGELDDVVNWVNDNCRSVVTY